jgi:protein-S-isoprenylcysteine O-methyltransferase Ste14
MVRRSVTARTIRLVPQLVGRIVGLAAAFAAALFGGAGTLAWPMGWAFLALFLAFVVALSVWLLRANPGLLVERMTGIGRADQKSWDKALMALAGVAFFAWLALMGIDAVRFRWSQVPGVLRAFGLALLVGAMALFFLTFRENAFLSPAVRVQADRGQTVVSTGPYRHVRHPMYAAFLALTAGTALLLGSWYALLGCVPLAALVAVRATLEERTLRRELAGYDDYVRHVRHRLIPFVW